MVQRKPFTKSEIKHLVWLHMKRDGMSYKKAVETVKNLVEAQNTLPKDTKGQTAHPEGSGKPTATFKEEFQRLKESSRRIKD